MKQITLKLFVVLSLLQGFAACTQDDPVPGSGDSEIPVLEQFAFTTDDNPDLSTGTKAVLCNDYYCISVPEGTDLTQLVPSIQCAYGAVSLVDDISYTPAASYDFSEGVHIVTVTSESGPTARYPILVKKGDPYIDDQVYSFMDAFHVPGVSISIMKGSEVKYSSGYGFADVETGTLTTPDHLFRVADISMQFCTLCIMTLVEQGRLSLDQQVFGGEGILRDVIESVTPYHESITVRHLLSHSSGITKGLSDPAFDDSYRFYSNTSPVPTDTLIQRTLDARPEPYNDGAKTWSAGMDFDYSVVGFCILHRIVEVVGGKDYESFLKEDVLEPMGITDTHIGGYRNERRHNECVYYSQDGFDGYVHPLRELAGALGVITSSNQMMKVLSSMDGDDEVPDTFSYEDLQQMYSPYDYGGSSGYHGYGLGWRLNNPSIFEGARYHGGDLAGTAALWVGGTYQKMSGAFLCNSRAYNSINGQSMDDNMYNLLNIFLKYFE